MPLRCIPTFSVCASQKSCAAVCIPRSTRSEVASSLCGPGVPRVQFFCAAVCIRSKSVCPMYQGSALYASLVGSDSGAEGASGGGHLSCRRGTRDQVHRQGLPQLALHRRVFCTDPAGNARRAGRGRRVTTAYLTPLGTHPPWYLALLVYTRLGTYPHCASAGYLRGRYLLPVRAEAVSPRSTSSPGPFSGPRAWRRPLGGPLSIPWPCCRRH